MRFVDEWLARATSLAFAALEANNRRGRHALIASLATLVTVGMWLAHLRYPYVFANFLEEDGAGKLLVALVLPPPFVVGFSIGHLLFPKINDPLEKTPGPMSGYLQIHHSEKQWRVAIAAGIVTGVNLILMIVTSQPS